MSNSSPRKACVVRYAWPLAALVAVAADARVVHEDVGTPVIGGDEAEALLGVEPLDRALRHAVVPFDLMGGTPHLRRPVRACCPPVR